MNYLVIANWKMNVGMTQVIKYLKSFSSPKLNHVEVVIAPPAVFLERVRGKSNLAAQDVSECESGAYTGEISASVLKQIGVKYCLVGHSERRIYQKETDQQCNRKIKQLLAAGITPVLCVGETAEERKSNKTKSVLRRQIKEGLKGVKSSVVVAYEPVWAISSFQKSKVKVSAKAEDIYQAHSEIKKLIDAKVLYGGSVNPENAKEISLIPNVDGFLVGSASLEPKSFEKIIYTYIK